ncbi:MAG: hypothetical protein HC917_06315 [Richelia sp. SM2_1_7]|nr:hypothetical protein [Richelia sp. SM2_1_7]
MKLKLYLEKDDTGYYGLRCSDLFNSFWEGKLIFHDVFEHWFEDTHKYFKGKYAYNISGEIVAYGALYYYVEELGLNNRVPYCNLDKLLVKDHYYKIVEAFKDNYYRYGELQLMCNVPKVRKSIIELDNAASELWNQLNETIDIQKLYAAGYNKAILRRLYHYGYNLAKRLVPYDYNNQEVLYNFICDWNRFTERVRAEDLYSLNYCDAVFNITKRKGIVSWTCRFTDYNKSILITEKNIKHLFIDNFYYD